MILSNKKSHSVSEILERFKRVHGIKTDVELAKIFGLRPNTIAMWKMRNYIDLNLIVKHSKYSLDYIIRGIDVEYMNKSQIVNEPKLEYTNSDLEKKLHELELENAELKGQVKILKELLLNKG